MCSPTIFGVPDNGTSAERQRMRVLQHRSTARIGDRGQAQRVESGVSAVANRGSGPI
jgi:hypothetical protein